MKKIITALLLCTSLSLAVPAQSAFADLVITNANIQTIDPKRASARSLAVVGERIVMVGSDADTKPLIGPGTKVIDAKGKLIVPGFNDAHVHFLETGLQLSSVDLRDAQTPQE